MGRLSEPVGVEELQQTGVKLATDEFTRRARAHDASHFLLYPNSVATVRSAEEVARLYKAAAQAGTAITFRSGGTSLSGQAGSQKVLVDTRRNFQNVEILDGGERVRVEPGVTVEKLNAHLARYGRKFGPDPASSKACTIGGVVANNSSGMACGIVENTYKTLESLVVVLPSGTVLDTGAPDADEKLRTLEPEIYKGLLDLRERVVTNPASVAKIKQQYSMKNTMGYGINSYLDFDNPVDILTHLMIGSEGTLGFIASATYRTIPIRNFVKTALVVFDNLFDANSSLPALVESGAATLELMDKTSLRVGQAFDDTPDLIKRIDVKEQAALLLEYQTTSAEELEEITRAAAPVLAQLPVAQPVPLASDPKLRAELWALRNGLYTSVAGARKLGTTALLEDVVVPVASLADTCVDLSKLFDEYHYADSVIFGHAKDGNIHFMITDRFEGEALDRYAAFTEAMVDAVLSHDGSLKAEHGTGRVMAPFVERQWGSELYSVMVATKRLFDPKGVLNDDVLISDDPEVHLKHLKPPVEVHEMVDRCVECGYCEPTCPARNLTLTPRQRIVMSREIAMARQAGDNDLVRDFEKIYEYDAVQTCAADGLCSLACPMKINTGLYMKEFRKELVPTIAKNVWTLASKHWKGTTTLASFAMSTVNNLKPVFPVIEGANKLARAVLGADSVPLVSRELPGGGKRRLRPNGTAFVASTSGDGTPTRSGNGTPIRSGDGTPTRHAARSRSISQPNAQTIIYLPACVNRMFGPAKGPGVQTAFEKLCKAAGIDVYTPSQIESLCCGTVWSSKGIVPGFEAMKAKVLPVLEDASRDGELTVVVDASSCTEGFLRFLHGSDLQVKVIDAVEFTAETILPKLPAHTKLKSVTIHQTCSSTIIGLNPHLSKVAAEVAEEVVVPVDNGCCAFAGDRGMLHPELTYSATRPEAAEVAGHPTEAYASCNRTCELGMTRATGKTYRHILELLAERL
ncbi:MAG: FAD-binding oxidoreductase [Propionibacteriaceae bacterium]|jgi:D-lactate dehydrogenase|nr:FAD-binding oxidoreductase [Propionibacteriaceae bacterium]